MTLTETLRPPAALPAPDRAPTVDAADPVANRCPLGPAGFAATTTGIFLLTFLAGYGATAGVANATWGRTVLPVLPAGKH